jgi:hypothetical protein
MDLLLIGTALTTHRPLIKIVEGKIGLIFLTTAFNLSQDPSQIQQFNALRSGDPLLTLKKQHKTQLWMMCLANKKRLD